MSKLPDPISEVLRDTVDEARIRRLWRGVEVRQSRARPNAWPLAAGVAAFAAAAIVLLWLRPTETSPAPIALTDGGRFEVVEASSERVLSFDDGSRIVLSSGARLETLRNDGQAIAWLLARGTARFEVEPNGPRTWTIETGVATVDVVGTVFVIDRGTREVTVTVERGIVMVRGERVPDRAARLLAGEALTIPVGAHRAAVPDSVPQPEESPPATPAARPERTAMREEPRAGSNGRAPREVELDAQALLAQADEARRAGRTDEAVALLERAMNRADDPAAGVAAFTLGRLEAERNPGRAAAAFDRALASTLPPALREDALARRAEAHRRAGAFDRARTSATEYLREYPTGRHAARMRQLASP